MNSLIRRCNHFILLAMIIILCLCSRAISQTWTFQRLTGVPSGNWKSVAMSDDGTIMYVVAPSSVYRSLNSGVTWSRINANLNSYYAVACDSTCTVVTIGANSNGIWSNIGGSFTQTYSNSNTYTIYQIVMDSTGKYVVAMCCKSILQFIFF